MLGETVSHFAVERRLGAGGMATVFLARDLALARPVALKIVTGAVDPSFRERLVREAKRRDRYNFAIAWTCAPEFSLVELARASLTLERPGVDALLEQARAAGALEARLVLDGTLSWDVHRPPGPSEETPT